MDAGMDVSRRKMLAMSSPIALERRRMLALSSPIVLERRQKAAMSSRMALGRSEISWMVPIIPILECPEPLPALIGILSNPQRQILA